MLYTLTTNPAVDVNMETECILPNTVNRTDGLVFTPNGKGLNVSFTLRHFNIPSGIMGYFGGFTGKYITDYCKSENYPLVYVETDQITRVNFFVNDSKDEYKFVNKGPLISVEKQEELLKSIKNLSDITYLTINGSAANGQTDDFYDRIFHICDKKNVPVILDISSSQLKSLLKYKPLLIKPNNDEMKAIFGFESDTEEEIISSLHKLHELGAQNILLTMGEKGSYFYDGKDMYHCGIKEVIQKSSACAGDAFLAGFLSIWLNDRDDVINALKRAAASGANTAESDGLGDFSMVEEYQKDICIKKLVWED